MHLKRLRIKVWGQDELNPLLFVLELLLSLLHLQGMRGGLLHLLTSQLILVALLKLLVLKKDL